ncbi:MAG: hypothetical protein EXS03_04140 [Phycisphaerales bacterium]|nr:hypothetical protein [Phycisphaerales bacterium]
MSPRIAVLALACVTLTVPGFADAADDTSVSALPALPPTPSRATVPTVVLLQRVELNTPYETDFRVERSKVTSGWLMVITGRADILAPRALAQPLLLAGGDGWTESVEWFNHGESSLHRVCFIPQTTEASKAPLAAAHLRVWFGSPMLPEQVDAKTLVQESEKADAAGIVAANPAQAARPLAEFADRTALIEAVNALVKQYSPKETQAAGDDPAAAPASGVVR